MTETKRSQNKPVRRATKNYRKDKTINTKKKTGKVSTTEAQEPLSLKPEQVTTPIERVRNEFIPEVSGYDDIPTKNSANVQEDDLKEAISNVQKGEEIKSEEIQEAIYKIEEPRERSYYEKRSNDYEALWQNNISSWIDIYKVFSENVAKMTREYWMTPFWISRRSEYNTSDKSEI